jgi:hypothetical protein
MRACNILVFLEFVCFVHRNIVVSHRKPLPDKVDYEVHGGKLP